MNDTLLKHYIDGGAALAALGWWVGLLPTVLNVILTTLAIGWYGIRFYEYVKNKKRPTD